MSSSIIYRRTHISLKKTGIVFFWLMIWQVGSKLVDNPIILVGPIQVIRALIHQSALSGFWQSILFSFGKISLGFLIAFILGILLGSTACRFKFVLELLSPIMALMKSIPVASFVVLALIWFGSENLSIFISFLVVFPMIYMSTIAGIKSTDPSLLEMANVFHMSGFKKGFYLYRPSLIPYLKSSLNTALGMSFKSGIAAEVIGVPGHSIGEKLYMAKIYLSTADLFAWTLVIIGISFLFEIFFLWLIDLTVPNHKKRKGRGI